MCGLAFGNIFNACTWHSEQWKFTFRSSMTSSYESAPCAKWNWANTFLGLKTKKRRWHPLKKGAHTEVKSLRSPTSKQQPFTIVARLKNFSFMCAGAVFSLGVIKGAPTLIYKKSRFATKADTTKHYIWFFHYYLCGGRRVCCDGAGGFCPASGAGGGGFGGVRPGVRVWPPRRPSRP